MTKSRKKITSLVVAVMYALCILVAAPVQAYAYTPDTHSVAYTRAQKAAQTLKALKALAKLPTSTTAAKAYDNAYEYTLLVKITFTAANEVLRAKNMGVNYKGLKNYYRLAIAKARVAYLKAVIKLITPTIALINALPTTVTIANAAQINAANAAFTALTAAQKKLVPNKAKLNAAVAALAALSNTDVADAAAVVVKIAALPLPAALVVADEAAVVAAKAAYTALTAAGKLLVTNLAVLTAAELKIASFKTVATVSAIADVTTPLGTAAVLPTTVTVTLDSGTTDLANVTWATTPDVSVLGTTAIAGTLSAPAGKVWTLTTAQKAVTVNVTVVSVLAAQLAKVTNAVVSTVPFAVPLATDSQNTVEIAMLALANDAVDDGFTVSIVDSSYNVGAKAWTGKFKVTNTATGAYLADASFRVLTIVNAPSAAGAKAELLKIDDVYGPEETVTVPYGTANTQAGVEAALLTLANAEISTSYTATIAAGSTYSTVSKLWTGKFTVTNNTTAANTATDEFWTRYYTIETAADTAPAAAQLAKITNAVVGTVPFVTDVNSKGAVEDAMVTLADDAISTGFYTSIVAGSTYSYVTKLWTGKFMVTDEATNATSTDAAYRNITIASEVSTAGAETELAKITTGLVETVPYGTANTQTGVEAAMLTLANAEISTSYTATIAAGSTYSTTSKIWTGKFKVTNNTTAANTATDENYRYIDISIAASTAGATAELAKITNAVVGTVPFGTANIQNGMPGVEEAMLTLANAEISAAYTATIAEGSTYSTVTKLWTGKFIVTETAHTTNTATDAAYRNITIATAVDVSGATTQLGFIADAEVKTLPAGTPNTQAAVEAAMLVLANAEVSSDYTVTIASGSTYSTAFKAWSGKFTVTNNVTPTNTKTDSADRTFIITISTL